jgi:hypothetical protein
MHIRDEDADEAGRHKHEAEQMRKAQQQAGFYCTIRPLPERLPECLIVPRKR